MRTLLQSSFAALVAIALIAVGIRTAIGQQPIRIMPLGDSLVQGWSESVQELSAVAGWRRPLWRQLTAAGYDVDFVGSQQNGLPDDFDVDNEGHGAWQCDHLAGWAGGWLDTYQPDVVLVECGTNELHNGFGAQVALDNLANLLHRIHAYRSDVIIIVTTPTPMSDPNLAAERGRFAALLPGLVRERQKDGWRIHWIDAGDVSTWDGPGHMSTAGAQHMADRWFGALTVLMPPPSPVTLAPSPAPSACSPRPRLSTRVQGQDSTTLVTISSPSQVSRVEVTSTKNAQAEATVTDGRATITVQPQTPGLWLISFTVHDACGPWPSFVGSGSPSQF